MNKFKKDPYFFLKCFTVNALLFGLADLLLVGRSLSLTIHGPSLILIPAGLVLGLISATAFHNTSHGNIRPKVLNFLVGELTANFSLEDMRCFRLGHMLHHRHVDDPKLDPHPPKGLSFLEFIATSRQKTIGCITHLYYKSHGKSAASERNVMGQIILFHVAALLKLIFWFLLFGPEVFILFFIPAYLSYFFGFAHLNYISHLEDERDIPQIRNHDGSAFYRVMNLLTSGGYYHRNHHLAPRLYNPSKLEKVKASPSR
jgi:fatty acid desaturase